MSKAEESKEKVLFACIFSRWGKSDENDFDTIDKPGIKYNMKFYIGLQLKAATTHKLLYNTVYFQSMKELAEPSTSCFLFLCFTPKIVTAPGKPGGISTIVT